MQIKDEIRQEIKEKRRHIENKSDLDSAVCANVINSHIFKNADTILCYSALRYEILTDESVLLFLIKRLPCLIAQIKTVICNFT